MIPDEEKEPFVIINEWLENEKLLGCNHPNRMVLATTSLSNVPSSRIVAIREITHEGILFFTQKETKKVHQLREVPYASATLWLARQQRQVIVDGPVKALTNQENRSYWEKISREQQLRFSAYAPSSGRSIDSLSILDERFQDLERKFKNTLVPMCPYYCGFRVIPECIYFYTLGSGSNFSEVLKYELIREKWRAQLLSP